MAHSHPTVAMPSKIIHPKGHMAIHDLVEGSGSAGSFELLIESKTPLFTSLFRLEDCLSLSYEGTGDSGRKIQPICHPGGMLRKAIWVPSLREAFLKP